MDEQNNNTNNPKTKKSLGMLIMILALVLVVVILVIVIVASSGGSDDTTPAITTTDAPTGTTTGAPATTTTPSTATTTAPGTTPSTPTSTRAPVSAVAPTLTETPATAGDDGKVTVNSADAATGTLILVDATHAYTYGSLFAGGADAKAEDVLAAGFYRIASNDIMKFSSDGYDSFLRQEAFKALAALLTTFDSVAGTDKPFLVTGYSSTILSTPTDSRITGNAFRIRIFDGKDSWNFDYSGRKVTVDGSSMTYEAWFKANCAKYGFVYEGLSGMSGCFRYVGSVHAAGVTAAGSLSAYLAGVKDGTIKTATAADGSTWNLSYVTASTEATTEIDVGAKATYVISGDNLGGFVVAVKAEATAD